MDIMPFVTLIFVAMPEAMLLSAVGLTVVGTQPRLKPILLIAVLYAITAFVVRQLPLTPGLHSIVLLLILAGFLFYQFKITLIKAVAAVFSAFVFLALGENIFLPLFMNILDLSVAEILASPWLRIAASLPNLLMLLIIFGIGYRVRKFHLR
ncbi:hypothetical protein [Dethiobacter alkaliphilus]|uniref:hypothetical protein n=1 Tax=Dethiobacter alkaliphilus TaxID=427926 RepID=UPI002226C229|nr:hypothetical protein [Dethiobacter alkaliphilus]MCW3489326.1 hypothetical protein [Dethiobacter alkaliphilus]